MNLNSTAWFFTHFFILLQLHIVLPVAGDMASDRQALLDFAAANPHPRKLNWNPNSPVCISWIGVTCDSNGSSVIGLRLPGFRLFGSIPPNTIGKLDALRVLSLRSNYLFGNLPSDIASLPSLRYLYLQHNNFSGKLPSSLSPQLTVLDLSFNSFAGHIPPGIRNLSQLTVLYLHNNSLAGSIPFLDRASLKVVNFSYNDLNGTIPNPLQKFPEFSFIGNSLLCGLPLKPCYVTGSPSLSPSYLPEPILRTLHSSQGKFSKSWIIAIAVGSSVALALLGIAIFVIILKKKDREESGAVIKTNGASEKPKDFGSGVQEPEKNKLFFFEGCNYSFDLEDLLRASAEVLGKGSFGTAYKAVLEDGTAVVVKRLREAAATKREFEQQMEVVGKINQHPNVVPLLAYYFSKDEKLLVYKYMQSGSLSALLHGNRGAGRTPFDWETRMKIALGISKAILHIHKMKSVHGNIKSSNVLLTQDLEACVSDIGLAPLMNFPTTFSRTIGYHAPEAMETRKTTQKSDVYSFGVLILEMLTGKAPLFQSGHDEDRVVVDLPRWVRSVVREEWTAEVFDVELLRFQNIEEEMVQMLQIGLACVARSPDSRPEIEDVVRMMEDVRKPELQNPASSEAESNVQTP